MCSEEDYRELADNLTETLRDMEDGSCTSTYQLLMDCGYDEDDFDEMDLFSLHAAILDAAEAKHITLDLSAHDGMFEGLLYKLDYVVRNKRARICCPRCGSMSVCRIQYGLPVFNEKLEEDLRAVKIHLGGCMIDTAILPNGDQVRVDPMRYCNGCQKAFGAGPYLVNRKDGTAEDYRDIVERIHFSVGGFSQGTKDVVISRTEKGAEAVSRMIPFGATDGVTRKLSQRTWEKLLNTLYIECFLNDWKKSYVDPHTVDGEQWELELTLEGNRRRRYYGSNEYPVCWKRVLRVFRPYLKEENYL